MSGINLAGLAIVADGEMRWVSLTAGALESTERIHGLAMGLYRVRTPTLRGVSVAAGMMRSRYMEGISVAGYNHVRREQRGLTIGLYNDARRLRGVQVGLLNRARNNPPGRRYLPIVNWHFWD